MQGSLLIVAAPSGAGKTTLVRGLLEQDGGVELSVSYTTRAPREGERDGVAYHFVDVPRFEALRDSGEFIEWAHVHGNYYGTSRSWLAGRLAAGRDVVLEIDWQGARQVRALFPEAVGIFILPPSMHVLEQRLSGRGLDSMEVVERRLAAAQDEMSHVGEFDFVIINKDLACAQADLIAAVRSARLRLRCQRARHPEVFESLSLD